ncbi:putative GntR family transcriptional regulator [Comamonas sp. E6]|nr:putative GntR family transcriptional regulator [Comamonas sp. E6]
MAENVETSLLEKLVERAVQKQLQPLQDQLWAHHWVLTEMTRQLPRATLLATAQRLEQMWQLEPPEQKERLEAVQLQWHQYLCQQGALIDGDTPPPLRPGQPVPERQRMAL